MDHLVGAYNIAAKAMGMTTEELGKNLKAGKIMAKDMVPKLAKALRELAAPGLAKSLKTLESTENRLLNTWRSFKDLIFTSGLGDFLGGLYTTFGNLLILMKPLANILGGITKGIQDVLYPVEYAIALFLDWAEAMGYLDSTTQNWSKSAQKEFEDFGHVIGWVLGVWGVSKIYLMTKELWKMIGVIKKAKKALMVMAGVEAAATGAAAVGVGAPAAIETVVAGAGAGLSLAGAGVLALGGAGLAYNILNPQTSNQAYAANKDYLSNMAKQNQNPLPWLNTNQIGSVGAYKQTVPIVLEVEVKGDVLNQHFTKELGNSTTAQ